MAESKISEEINVISYRIIITGLRQIKDIHRKSLERVHTWYTTTKLCVDYSQHRVL